MTKIERTTLSLIASNGASSVWISRSAGRVWFAGETKLNAKSVDALAAKGAIRFIRNGAGVAEQIEIAA